MPRKRTKIKIRQYEKMKNSGLLNLHSFLPILLRTLICLSAFLHIFLIGVSKDKLKSMSTPKSLTTSSHDIILLIISKVGFYLIVR